MEAKKVSFSYGEQPFITGLDATIKKGCVTTIIGPNGSGKSTLLNLLAKQEKVSEGTITFNDKNINSISQKELAKELAIVFQQHTSPGDITVERLIYYGRVPHKKFWEIENNEDEEIVQWALEVTNLGHLKDRALAELSGGERQRAWIAMALAQKPQVLFLDEPTTYLDVYYQLEVLELARKLNQTLGLTVVMVLHDINQAMQYSDHVIVMKKGKVAYSGKVEEVFTEQMIEEVYGIKAIMRWCEVNTCHYIVPSKLSSHKS